MLFVKTNATAAAISWAETWRAEFRVERRLSRGAIETVGWWSGCAMIGMP